MEGQEIEQDVRFKRLHPSDAHQDFRELSHHLYEQDLEEQKRIAQEKELEEDKSKPAADPEETNSTN